MVGDKINQTIKLKDGRTLGFDEYGSPDGKPIVLFHGTPGSRLEGRILNNSCVRLNVRCIAFDRPGIGLSDFKPKYNILSIQDDVIQLADTLKIDRFSILGVSGGGPYAVACALKNPQRINKVALVSSVSPYDVPGVKKGMNQSDRMTSMIARRAPWLLKILMNTMANNTRKNPDGFISGIVKEVPKADKDVLGRQEIRNWLIDTFLESVRYGPRGAARDYSLITRKWGFQIKDITTEVHLWQGEEDNMVPPAMGRYISSNIPGCKSRFVPNESHISLIVNNSDEICRELIA